MTKRKKKGLSILLVAKQNKAGLRAVKSAERMLRRYTDDIHLDRSTAFRLRKRGTSIKKFKGDFIVTLGGDGTFLMTSHRANVPILPVRIEGKGFLCTTDWEEFKKNTDRLFKKKFTTVERMRLKCTNMSGGRLSKYMKKIHETSYPLSSNEIAFARKRPSKLLNITMKIGDTEFKVTGDGVLFSTPHGSTAYAASAGGSIIDPEMEAISVIPLYPFYSKLKPFVIPSYKKIEVEIRGGECALIIDGHGGDYFKRDARFMVEKSRPVKVIVINEKNFYERIRKNLIEA